jgi:hypothetical protein
MTEPPCMDYSAYSLNELWDMVSPPDTLSQAQITSWYEMAILCGDQADNLTRALARLAGFWPPAPGSAAEAFSHLVQGLVASMSDDAANARKMSRSLSGIVGELDSAKAQMQDLMDQQAHYQQLPPAASRPGQLAFFESSSPSPTEYAPIGWQDDLRAQARTIMASTDAKIETIAAGMPVIHRFAPTIDDAGPPPPPPRPLPRAAPMPPMLQMPDVTGSRDITPPAQGSVSAGTPIGSPILAGTGAVPNDTTQVLPTPSGTGPLNARPSGVGNNPTYRPPEAFQPMIGRTQAVPDPSAETSSQNGMASEGQPEGGQGTAPGSLLSPGVAGRPSTQGNRSAARPGGRAALWASQRKRKPDRSDPWSVRHGVPAVIEPSEPPEHDPGPGVIGLDT